AAREGARAPSRTVLDHRTGDRGPVAARGRILGSRHLCGDVQSLGYRCRVPRCKSAEGRRACERCSGATAHRARLAASFPATKHAYRELRISFTLATSSERGTEICAARSFTQA